MDFIRLHIDLSSFNLSLDISLWLIAVILVLLLVGLLLRKRRRRYKLVSIDISLGSIGKAQFKPNNEDLQIAHRIWTELVTRKAAIPFDPEHDVIVEVYDSWYALFQRVRELVANLPADLVRREQSTKEIVRIATATLNNGLRPHLTKWQARFRNWYEMNKNKLATMSPQDLQKQFPQYNDLLAEVLRINVSLIEYAKELQKVLKD